MKQFSLSVFSILFLISGCTSYQQPEIPDHIRGMENLTAYPADTKPVYDIDLVPVQSFSDTDEHTFGILGATAVDNAGRVYIADNRQNSVVIFQSDGTHLGTIGREGSGPGESRQLVGVIAKSGLLYTYDLSLHRLNVYNIPEDPTSIPEYSHAVIMNGENWADVAVRNSMSPLFYDIRPDGSFLVYSRVIPTVFRENPDEDEFFRYHIMSADGQTFSEPIFIEQQPKNIVTEWFIMPPSFAAEDQFAIAANGYFYSAWTADFLIRVLDEEGNYRRAVYYPFEKQPLSRDEAIQSFGDIPQLQDAVREMDLPENWPAIRSLMSDDRNRIWVSTIIEDDELYEWWVLDESGELLGRFEWPRNESFVLIHGDHLYARVSDSETGVRSIIKYDIQLTDY